jgi:hypothetical protein
MAHVFELTDEQYEFILKAAEATGRTPQDLFLAWAMEEESRMRRAHPTSYETDDWLRHLGVSDEEIEASKRRVRDEAEMPYDADA